MRQKNKSKADSSYLFIYFRFCLFFFSFFPPPPKRQTVTFLRNDTRRRKAHKNKVMQSVRFECRILSRLLCLSGEACI